MNDQIGFIAGEQGTILKTADGGLNWTVLPTNTFYPIESVWFTDEYNGWAVGGIPGHGYKTTDGGNTWFEFIVSNDKWYFDVYYKPHID